MHPVKLLDVVALLSALPVKSLRRGQVGTVVETLPNGAFEVEFSDSDGKAFALAALRPEELFVLYYELAPMPEMGSTVR